MALGSDRSATHTEAVSATSSHFAWLGELRILFTTMWTAHGHELYSEEKGTSPSRHACIVSSSRKPQPSQFPSFLQAPRARKKACKVVSRSETPHTPGRQTLVWTRHQLAMPRDLSRTAH